MSKTPKATNLEEATLAPTTGTQKKAPKVGLTMDPDYDEEEGKEKVPLEKPNEKKATKKDWTDPLYLIFFWVIILSWEFCSKICYLQSK